ncbi:hypothetical protein [Pseudomonas kilonensis]|uniref:hypothetical protein n=1 Tax=Pseudomonas kilonensis TaxID=132476 RepID=UPI00111462DA|nr:hypothetical protein [Pseudomonas kilonensis]
MIQANPFDGSSQHSEAKINPLFLMFPNQILTLWDADEQYDRQGGERREVWGQVGIGTSAYMAAIRAIKGHVTVDEDASTI